MKSILRIRFLTIFAFILLIAPFYDSCNENRFFKKSAASDAIVDADSSVVIIDPSHIEIQDSVQEQVVDSIIKSKNIFAEIHDFIDDKDSESAFEFASFNSIYFERPFEESLETVKVGIKEKDYKGFFFGLKNFSFLIIVIITFLTLIFSFVNKIQLIRKFTFINLFFLLVTIVCIFLEGLFETICQVKWGYYVFLTVQIIIFYFINKLYRELD